MPSGFQFIHWQWLLLIPFLWGALIWWYQNEFDSKQQASIMDVDLSATNRFYHPLVKQLIAASASISTKQSFWKQAMFWFSGFVLSLLVISLAQPVLTGKRLPDPLPERDIIFLVDTSISMQLKDYEQDGVELKRIEVLRNLLDEFTVKMQGEKISIILFAENAYVLVPLSSDQNLIRNMLRRITTTLAGRYTALGDALLMALNETINAQARNDLSANKPQEINKKRHQTFILFTDADASRGEVTSNAAAQLVAENNIPVFTIAIGSADISKDKKVKGGLYSSVDLPLLEEISKITKGQSYQVSDAITMQKALSNILKQSQNIAVPKARYEQQELYAYPLMLALLLLIVFQLTRLINKLKILKTRGDV